MPHSPANIAIRSGPWDLTTVEGFLGDATIPIRIATQGRSSLLVQSLWFVYEGSALWCCTQSDSVVANRLRTTPKCAFEIAADSPPYRGVRGTGIASLDPRPAGELLERLISRYLSDGNSSLAKWLRARVSAELAIRIDTLEVSSWDYSTRMD